MSFGFSPSDVFALTKLAYNAFEGAKQACGEHTDLTQELSCLVSVLNLIRSESSDPDSLLNKAQAFRCEQLHHGVRGCMRHVRRIGIVLDKYNGLSEEDRSVTQLWTRFRFGSSRAITHIAEIRRRICSYTSSIQMALHIISISSQSETAKALGKLCKTIETHVVKNKPRKEGSITSRNSSIREGTVSSKCSTDETFWKSLRRDLEKSGHKNKTIKSRKDLILEYAKELFLSTTLDDKEEAVKVTDSAVSTDQSTQISATSEATKTLDIATSSSLQSDQQNSNNPPDEAVEDPSTGKQIHSGNNLVLAEKDPETLVASEAGFAPEVENLASHPHFSVLLEKVVQLERSNQQYEQFLRSFNLDDVRSGAQNVGSSMPRSFPYTTDNILFSRGREDLNDLPRAQENSVCEKDRSTFAQNVRLQDQQQSDGEDIGFSEGNIEARLPQNMDARYQSVHEDMYNESPSEPVISSVTTQKFDPHERQDRKEMKARCSDEDEIGASMVQEENIVDFENLRWEGKPGILSAIVNEVHYASADNIHKGNFDLYGADGEHVAPTEWESYIKPNMIIKIRVRAKPLVYSYTPVAYNSRPETHRHEHYQKATAFDQPQFPPPPPWISPRLPKANIWVQPNHRSPKRPPRTRQSSTRSYSPPRRAPSPPPPKTSPPRSRKKQSSSSSSRKTVSIDPRPCTSQTHRKHSSSDSQTSRAAKHTRKPPSPVRNSYSTSDSDSDSELESVTPAEIRIVNENSERAVVIRDENQESDELLVPENEKFLPIYENEKFLLTPEMMELLGVRTSRRSQ